SSAVLPRGVAPSAKATLPVATPAPPVTVAVNVTLLPKREGFKLDTSAVVVAQGVCATTAEKGVFVRPVVVMLRISMPGPPLAFVATRNRRFTLLFANVVPRFSVTGTKFGYPALRPLYASRPTRAELTSV